MRPLLDRIRTTVAGRYWGRAASAGGIPTWMGEIVVRERINRRISGAPSVWPTDWLAQNIQRPLATGVSLGCGEGALERDLVQKQICRTILGIDVSEAAIELARKRAAEMKTGSISYRVGDLNRLDLEGQTYEGAFFHQSLHHVSDLDRCLDAVRRSLSAGGLLYLDEYVGPGRREWKRSLIDDAEAIYQTLPDELKRRRRLTYPIDRRDPTEAIRSGDIIRFLEKHFVIESRRDYGGNLLSLIHPHLKLDLLTDENRAMILEALLDIEDRLLSEGASSYYAVILARPKKLA